MSVVREDPEREPPVSVVVALGSNLGDRPLNLRRAVAALEREIRIVLLSSVWETEPVECPPGSQVFLNMVLAGFTRRTPEALLERLEACERVLGRRSKTGERNLPRVIDLDIVLYGSRVLRSASLELPHPRFRSRAFVTEPLRELGLPWVDPLTGLPLVRFEGEGEVRRIGALWCA